MRPCMGEVPGLDLGTPPGPYPDSLLTPYVGPEFSVNPQYPRELLRWGSSCEYWGLWINERDDVV